MYHCNCRYIVICNWLSVMLNLKSFFKERMLLADSCTPGALAHVNSQFQNRVGRCSNRAVQLTSNDLPLCQISSVGDLAKIKTNKLFLNNVSAQNPLENRKFPMRCSLHLFFYNVFFSSYARSRNLSKTLSHHYTNKAFLRFLSNTNNL